MIEFIERFKTDRLFMHKVREAMKLSENSPMKGNVNVVEYVVDGYEEGKLGRNYVSFRTYR